MGSQKLRKVPWPSRQLRNSDLTQHLCFPWTVQEIMTNWCLMLVHHFRSDVLRLHRTLRFEIHAGTRSLVAVQSFCWLLGCKLALLPTVPTRSSFPQFCFQVQTAGWSNRVKHALLSCVPGFQLEPLLLGKTSGPQIIALVRRQCWNYTESQNSRGWKGPLWVI